jgi:hypothetical protein
MLERMDRRAFFSITGAVALAPLVGCEVRDAPGVSPSAGTDFIVAELAKFRTFVVAEGVDPALDFRPLRQPRR